jgi:hypothetical protein
MSEKSLVAKAQEAVGGSDTIVAAAVFQPRGMGAGLAGGHVGGEMVGQLVGGQLGGAIGGLVGSYVGVKTEEKHGGFRSDSVGTLHPVTWSSILALSDARLYAWRLHHGLHQTPGEVIFTIDRPDLSVTVHNHVTSHSFEVANTATGERWELESDHVEDHFRAFFSELHPVEA